MVKLHEFFDKYEWTQGTCARSANGLAVDPSSENARKFCVLGALYKIHSGPVPSDILRKLADAFGPNLTADPLIIITNYNDTHTKDEVLSILREVDV